MKNLALCLSLFAIGCAKKTPQPDVDTAGAEKGATKAAAVEKAPAAIPASVAKMMANFQRVHFEFNSFTLTAESRKALEENAEIMNGNNSVRIEIQGHADDRGTSEYNLALGEKRARSVAEYLRKLGVESGRVETISYGEEKPVAKGSGDVAWSKNRRAEFRVTWGMDAVAGTTAD